MKTPRQFGFFLYRNEQGQRRTAKFLLATSLALGVAALVALESFTARIENTIRRDSHALLAADYQVQAWRPFDDQVWKGVHALAAPENIVQQVDFTATVSYGPASDPQALTVSVRSIEGNGYPFYGEWITDPQLKLSDLETEPRIVLDSSLRARGIKLGDKMKLGRIEFTVAAFLVQEPQSLAGAFTLGPRVIVHKKYAEASGLIGRGARAFRSLLIKNPLPTEAFRKAFRKLVPDPHWRLVTPERSNRQAERIIGRIRGFLSFVGLTGLFLGGVGLFVIFRSQFLLKLSQFLTLRCLGANRKSLLWYAFYNSLEVAGAGWILGTVLGVLIESLMLHYAHSKLNLALASISYFVPALLGAVVAAATVSLAVFLPMLEVLRVPVSQVIRQDESQSRGFSLQDGVASFVVALVLIFLVSRQVKMATVFFSGLAGAVVLLLLISALLTFVMARLRLSRASLSLRHAVWNFVRRPARSQLMVISLGLGIFLVASVLLIASSLRSQLNVAGREGVPNLYLIGIPAEQLEAVRHEIPAMEALPVTQARMTEVNGKPVVAHEPAEGDEESANRGSGEERYYQSREYFITRKERPSAGERIVQGGSLFGAPVSGLVRASVEEGFAQGLKLKLGDHFKMEIAGVPVEAIVQSFRKVDWFDLKPNFFVVFNAKDLAEAPMDYAAFARVPSSEISAWQTRLIRKFPQISVLDGEAVGKRIMSLLDQLSFSVFSVSLFSLGSCIFVFVGITVARRPELVKDLSLWRCLGLRDKKLRALLSYEALITGLMASLTAGLASLLSVAALCHFVLDVPMDLPQAWKVIAGFVAAPLLLTLGLRMLTGLLLRQSPADLFRAAEES